MEKDNNIILRKYKVPFFVSFLLALILVTYTNCTDNLKNKSTATKRQNGLKKSLNSFKSISNFLRRPSGHTYNFLNFNEAYASVPSTRDPLCGSSGIAVSQWIRNRKRR